MTLPLPNLQAPLAKVVGGLTFLIPPWNSFFQQFVQPAPAVADIGISASPFTANAKGTLIIQGATTVSLIRGVVTIDLTGQEIIPISVSDTVSWTGVPTSVQFLGA